jgi:iron complex outermembrane receptor protein
MATISVRPSTSRGANAGTPNWNFYRTFSDDAVLGRITARYEFSRDFMTYASFAKGYKGQAVDADMFVTAAAWRLCPPRPKPRPRMKWASRASGSTAS